MKLSVVRAESQGELTNEFIVVRSFKSSTFKKGNFIDDHEQDLGSDSFETENLRG
jgi:hypothetical protein